MKLLMSLLLASTSAFASEFEPGKTEPQKINCSVAKGNVSFDGLKVLYPLYEKNLESIKSVSCEKIEIQGLQFFIVQFTSTIKPNIGTKKILTFEIALQDKKTKELKTVRSEIVDELDMSGDTPDSEFTKSIKTTWGKSSKDKTAMVQFTETEKNKKPFSFVLKLNRKNTWLENVF